jgi:hypothetical protein
MAKETLEALKSPSLLVLSSLGLSPKALHRVLQTSETVIALREAVLEGDVNDNDIVFFVGPLLAGEVIFPYEISLIGLAVALETIPQKWANDYISGLYEIRIKELPMAWQVAEICLGNKC